jgi:hypothetical protein
MQTLRTLLVTVPFVLNAAACATDDPAESRTEQDLSGLIAEGDLLQEWACFPGSVENTSGAMYQPYVYVIGNQGICTDAGTYSFCGFAFDESQVTHAWYTFMDYQGNQYCGGVIHYRIWSNPY